MKNLFLISSLLLVWNILLSQNTPTEDLIKLTIHNGNLNRSNQFIYFDRMGNIRQIDQVGYVSKEEGMKNFVANYIGDRGGTSKKHLRLPLNKSMLSSDE